MHAGAARPAADPEHGAAAAPETSTPPVDRADDADGYENFAARGDALVVGENPLFRRRGPGATDADVAI